MNKLQKAQAKIQHILYSLVSRHSISYQKLQPIADLAELGCQYGGWVIPSNMFDEKSICNCAGCREDINFDLAVNKQAL